MSMDGMTLRTFFFPAKSAKDFFLKFGVVRKVMSSIANLKLRSGKGNRVSKNVVIAKTPFFFSFVH